MENQSISKSTLEPCGLWLVFISDFGGMNAKVYFNFLLDASLHVYAVLPPELNLPAAILHKTQNNQLGWCVSNFMVQVHHSEYTRLPKRQTK